MRPPARGRADVAEVQRVERPRPGGLRLGADRRSRGHGAQRDDDEEQAETGKAAHVETSCVRGA